MTNDNHSRAAIHICIQRPKLKARATTPLATMTAYARIVKQQKASNVSRNESKGEEEEEEEEEGEEKLKGEREREREKKKAATLQFFFPSLAR